MDSVDSTRTENQFNYPASMKVYGIVADDHTASALIRVGLHALSKEDGDLLVFLCPATDDIRERTDWQEIAADIRFRNGRTDYEVRLVNSQEDLMNASLNMRVIHLPEHTLMRI